MFSTIYLQTTAHPWCDGHSTSISACGVWGVGGKGQDSNLQERVSYTYILRLLYSRILSYVKKKKKTIYLQSSKILTANYPTNASLVVFYKCSLNPTSLIFIIYHSTCKRNNIYICKNLFFIYMKISFFVPKLLKIFYFLFLNFTKSLFLPLNY